VYLIRKIWNPSMFQGHYKRKNYFEGWYYKCIDEEQKCVYSFIPGVAYGKNGEGKHAFIQVIDGITHKTYYISFPIEAFWYSMKDFRIRIGNNEFTNHYISISIETPEICICGKLDFLNRVPYPQKWNAPGIMGPFSFVPRMECYHGVVNIHHEIQGSLWIDGRENNFSKGYGYIEKDWGRSFPEEWIWMQCNHFKNPNTSFMFSIALIPWLHSQFVGFLSFLKIEDHIYTFSTYSGAKIKKLGNHQDKWFIVIEDNQYQLEVYAKQKIGGYLKAPKNGQMSRMIVESIHSKVKVCLKDKKTNQVLFLENGTKVGMEIAGDIINWHKKSTR